MLRRMLSIPLVQTFVCFSFLFLSVAVIILGAFAPATAAMWTVNTTVNDGSPGTLSYALGNASAGDTINITATGTIIGAVYITKDLTINGPGASSLTISGNNTGRVFNINSGATVSISGLTVSNGKYNGIYNLGTMTVTNCTISGNSGSGYSDFGGGIRNDGTMTVTNCTISGNTGGNGISGGGGIANLYGTMTVTNSTISGNSAGVLDDHGVGGGIFNLGTMTVTNSTISGNSVGSLGIGAGIANWPAPWTTMTVTNCTISGNSGGWGGGSGIWNDPSFDPASITVTNTILSANNPGGNCLDSDPLVVYVIDGGYNIVDDSTCRFYATGSMELTDPQLDTAGLKNNGGSTKTIALQAGSPAIDAIPVGTSGCGTTITTDQRGISRPQGTNCDIGAYEFVSATVPGAPTGVTATAGNAQATVTFTAPASNGGSAITSYTVTSSPGSITGSGASSPITVTGLTNGTAYTFTVTATNAIGTGTASAASNSVTPAAPQATENLPNDITLTATTLTGCTASSSTPSSQPNGYSLINTYNITCTSTSGTITVTIPYNPSSVPSGKEGTLKMFHWNGSSWVNVTTSVNTGAHTVTGQVASLSPFGIGYYLGSGYTTGANTNILIILALLAISAGLFILRKYAGKKA